MEILASADPMVFLVGAVAVLVLFILVVAALVKYLRKP